MVVLCGESVDPRENVGAQVCSEGHGEAGSQVDRERGAQHLREGDGEHLSAEVPDEPGVALSDALVDDSGVEVGQFEGGDCRCGLKDDDCEDFPDSRF